MYKTKLKYILIISLTVVVYFLIIFKKSVVNDTNKYIKVQQNEDHNVWLIFAKTTKNSSLRFKFHKLLENILTISSITIKFHIIVDKDTRKLAADEISDIVSYTNKPISYKFYDIEECINEIKDIVEVMAPRFSSKPGTYYSDALFFISLGLHRIAKNQKKAVLLDCDLLFKKDISILFNEFNKFKSTALFGLAPELAPVYYHLLYNYRKKHNTTTFGEYYHDYNIISNSKTQNISHPKGFQGYNSGVILFNLELIKKSNEYKSLLKNESVIYLTNKYQFSGHLGDQDFYTLIGYEYPHLIQTLNCGFNRQICIWWRDHGYKYLFDKYNKCPHPIVILHGNCNTKLPEN